MVVSEGALQVGRVAEHDQAQPVRRALVPQLGQHVLDRRQPVDVAAIRQSEVRGCHGAGQIDRDHQVTARFLLFDRRPYPFRLGRRQHQAQPHEVHQEVLGEIPLQDRGAGFGTLLAQLHQFVEKRYPDGVPALPVRGQETHQ